MLPQTLGHRTLFFVKKIDLYTLNTEKSLIIHQGVHITHPIKIWLLYNRRNVHFSSSIVMFSIGLDHHQGRSCKRILPRIAAFLK